MAYSYNKFLARGAWIYLVSYKETYLAVPSNEPKITIGRITQQADEPEPQSE